MGNATKPVKANDIDRFLLKLGMDSGPQFAVLARLGFETGLRVSDLLKLKYGAFKGQKRVLQIVERKTGKIKRMEITMAMRKPVEALRKASGASWEDYIFSVVDGQPMSRTTAYRHIRMAGEACGIGRVSPHSLRKTYAVSKYLESGGDLEATREAMNHKYTDTTLYSYLLAGVDMAELVKKTLA